MNEEEILQLIKGDVWMMDILRKARELNLSQWMIGAGFVRNKVWDYLHGFKNDKVRTNDIDLIYFEPEGNNDKEDRKLSKKLGRETGVTWEAVNQSYAHVWHNRPPYKDAVEALSEWVETATCVAVRLGENDKLTLFAPHGISDLVNLIVRQNPSCGGDLYVFKERIERKHWLSIWPRLKVVY